MLQQLDLIEKGKGELSCLLFLQTVLKEVRRRDACSYERVKSMLISPPDSVQSAIFSNENRRETYVERSLVGESESEYDVKCVVSAVKWLTAHWECFGMVPQLLTDNPGLERRYRSDGVAAVSVKDYVAQHPELCELYSEQEAHGSGTPSSGSETHPDGTQVSTAARSSTFIYSDYLSERKVRAGLKGGRLFKGTIRPSTYNVLESWVSVCLDPTDKAARTKVLILGRENQNRAIDGDIVVVELFPRDQWKRPSNLAVEQEDVDADSDGEGAEQMQEIAHDEKDPSLRTQTDNTADLSPTGRVVAISRRGWRPYCGAISGTSFTGGERALFVPTDRKVPKIRIKSRRIRELLGQKLIVIIDRWDRSSIHPTGHIIKEIGQSGDKEAETEVILIENGVPTRKFSEPAMACLPDENWKVSEEHVKSRWDLRSWTVCSVDPPGCTDIDDALHFRRLNDAEVEVGVHIADVTAFVAHGSALDQEAAERGTTVYLVDRRIEMLPSLLSGNLCSLQANVERLAFSVMIRMSNDGNVLAAEFGRSVIKSAAALTYQQAQERIDRARESPASNSSAHVDSITQSLLGLADIARMLRDRRMSQGALTLASPEVRFKISELTDSVTDAYMYETRETNRMVEEFMLLANIVVAERILQQFPHCALLRRHPRPSSEMFEPLLKAAKAAGFDIDVSNSKLLNESLARVDAEAKKGGDNYMGTLLRILATRSMTQAVYFSSGEVADPEYLHYGLAAPVYTHFTSPIRRYADVLVHRLLSASLGFASLPMSLQDSKRMSELADVINERHQCAQFAARASSALYTLMLFKDQTLVEDARIMRVLANGLVVLVPRYGVEGIVQFDEDMSPVLDDLQQSVTIKDGHTYKVLTTVRVRIRVDSAPERKDRVLYEIVHV